MKKFALLLGVLMLGACDDTATKHNLQTISSPPPPENSNNPHDLKALADELSQDSQDIDTTPIKPITTPDGKVQIDWTHIDTKEPKADLTTYNYPIALDSQAVKNYAAAYNITNKQAQHSIVIGMAAPEALGKVLDQLQGKYLGHQLTDGAKMSLVIHTTFDVVGETHDYVFADTFGKGLVIPVVISPRSP